MKKPDFEPLTLQTLVVFALLIVFPDFTLLAQNPDTVRVTFNRTETTPSNVRLWQNALYRWTVQGRANIGQFSTAPMVVDAAYFSTNLGITALPQRPAMPLDNNAGAATICGAFQQTPAASPCNIYFATNALPSAQTGSPAALDPAFARTDAVRLKQYAFRPQETTFQQNSRYTAQVLGANIPAQFLFVEGLGFGNNQTYRDNPTDTALVVRIERQSPELLVLAEPSFNATGRLPMRVLNDNVPTRVLRDTTIDFGSYLVNSPVQTRRVVLKNRGIEPLHIVRIETASVNAAFTVTSSFGRLDNEIVLGQNADSVVITFTFTPRTAQQFTGDIRIITNDSTNTSFLLRLRATAALGTLVQIDTLTFNDIRVGAQPTRTFSLFRAAINESFWIDSIQQPTQSFEVRNLASQEVPANSQLMQMGFIIFRPNVIGNYLDSVVLRGRNLVDYKIYLRGNAIQSAAVISRQGQQQSDILDFGAMVTGASTTQTFTIRNTGNLPLNVVLTLEPSRNGRPSDVSEFILETAPTTISEITGSEQTYTVRFTATSQILEGRKEALLRYIVRDATTGNQIEGDVFTLVARRLPNVIAPNRTVISFDSVYVGIQARDTLTVRNTSPNLTGTFLRQGSISAPFGAETIPMQRPFPVGSASVLGLTFQPTQVGGRDTILVLESRVDSTSAVETSRVQLRGTGVRQQFDLLRITSDSLFPNNTNTLIPASMLVNGTRTYVADIGCVRLGESKDVRITFQNRGNLPFGVWNQFSRIEPTQTQGFTVISRFQQQRRILPEQRDTSLVLRFRPSIIGEQQIEYTLQSDIRQNIGGTVRIPTAPDSTTQIIIILRAKGIVPEIEPPVNVSVSDVTLGARCGSKTTQRVVVRNPAAANCGAFTRVLSATLSSSNSPFRLISGQQGFTIPPASTASVEVEFEPTALGTFTTELVLRTDAPAPRDVVRIGLTGRAVELPNVNVSIATTHTAAPGTPLVVPIVVTPFAGASGSLSGLTLADNAVFQISYDRTLLEFADVASLVGTAAAGGRVQTRVSSQGTQQTLNVTVLAPQSAQFLARETLVAFRFNTYLGRETSSTLRLSDVRFGDSMCPQIQVRTITSGLFQTDSVCNLLPKVEALRNVPPRTIVAEVTPNPITDGFGKITFLVNEQAHITITLLDAQGASILTLMDADIAEGIYEERLPLGGLPTGTYFCEVRSRTTSGVIEREVRRVVAVR